MRTIATNEVTGTRAAWKDPLLAHAGTGLVRELLSMARSYIHGVQWSPASGLDSDLFLRYCREHGVGGILGTLDIDAPPGDTLHQFGTEQYLANLIKHERMRHILLQLSGICRGEGIQYCVVKGPALSDLVYGDGGIRSYGDLDILLSDRKDIDILLSHHSFSEAETVVSHRPRSLTQPGRVHVMPADALGEPLEFFYPLAEICDPIFDFLSLHARGMLAETLPGDYAAPPHTLHFLFLLLHLQKHLGVRLIWHLDVVVYFLRYGSLLDFDLIRRELLRLQLTQISTFLADFYREHFEIDLKISFERPAKGWNTDIARRIASAEQLHGRVTANRIRQYPVAIGLLVATRFFILTDPENQGLFAQSKAASWLASLLQIKTGRRCTLINAVMVRVLLLIKPAVTPIVRYCIRKLYRNRAFR